VRDLLLGKKPKDFDVASSATPAQIKRVLRNARIIGKRFRLVHAFYADKIIEIATFRSCKDGSTGNEFGTIDDDVRRRDFTLNALFYDPQEQTIIDYVGGVQDIRKKRIRPIIALNLIFVEDPVRMLRAVKFAAACGFSLPYAMKRKIRAQYRLLGDVSPSRRTEELSKIIKSPQAAEIIDALCNYGLYGFLQGDGNERILHSEAERKAYLDGFRAMAAKKAAANEDISLEDGLLCLYRPFIEPGIDWTLGAEGFYPVYKQCRKFVMPMNPPRASLEQSLRRLYAEHGIKVTRVYYFDRPRGKPAEGEVAEAVAGVDGAKKKKRRRHRKKKNLATEHTEVTESKSEN
jgi:poly(A) polymerase